MIIGDGDVAKVLPEREGFIFFASGVSNSQETRESEYQREIDLLIKQDRDQHLVYFSSLAIFYSDTRYTQHKKQMESLIKLWFPSYTIMRLGNIAWGVNPHTLINHLIDQAIEGKPLELRNEYRYVISEDEFLHWIDLIPLWSCEMNCPGEMLKVKEIYERYVKQA